MIKIFNQQDKEIARYKLVPGENNFGSDTNKCQYIIKNVKQVLFSVALIDKDVYFIHFSQANDVFKDSTLKPYKQVVIPHNMLFEMHSTKTYYFQDYKFSLIDSDIQQTNINNNIVATQIIEEFSGTQVLDDIIPEPINEVKDNKPPQIYTTTQVIGTQDLSDDILGHTQILSDSPIHNVSEPSLTLLDFMSKNKLNTPGQDQYTQTEEQVNQQLQIKRTLFGGIFGSNRVKQLESQIIQEESQLPMATLVDDELEKQFKSQPAGTIIDEELENKFSSAGPQKSLPDLKKNYEFEKIDSRDSNLELNDLFVSVPSINQSAQNQQIGKLTQKGFIMSRTSQDSDKKSLNIIPESPEKELKEEKQEMEKNQQKEQKETREEKKKAEEKKHVKKLKQEKKKVTQLKKMTEQFNDESSEDLAQTKQTIQTKKQQQQQQQQQKQQQQQQQQQLQSSSQSSLPRQTVSIELTKNEDIKTEKQQNQVPNKKRGLRKLAKLNQDREVHTIAFSGFENFNEIPKQQELQLLGLEIITNNDEKFDILVIKEAKRTFKFLLALMHGAYIVNMDWLNDSLKYKEIEQFNKYIPNSQIFIDQYGFSIQDCIKSRDEYLQSNDNILNMFDGVYYVEDNVFPSSKFEIEQLIKLGGGKISKKATKKTVIVSDGEKGNGLKSDQILDSCMFI